MNEGSRALPRDPQLSLKRPGRTFIELDPALAKELEDTDASTGGAGIDEHAEEVGLGLGKLGGLVDLLGGGEEIEEERNGEEGGEEEEAFGLGLERRFRVCWGWREEVHARVQLVAVGAVGRDVVGGRRPPLLSPTKRSTVGVSRVPRPGSQETMAMGLLRPMTVVVERGRREKKNSEQERRKKGRKEVRLREMRVKEIFYGCEEGKKKNSKP
jgi:hypothetical protein